MNKKEIANRIRLFGEENFEKVKDFAEALDMSNSNLQQYLSGRVSPGVNLLIKLQELGCDTNWVLTGLGNPPGQKSLKEEVKEGMTVYRAEKDKLLEEVKQLGVSPEELELIRKIRQIPGSQAMFNQILDGKILIKDAFDKLVNTSTEGHNDAPASNQEKKENGNKEMESGLANG